MVVPDLEDTRRNVAHHTYERSLELAPKAAETATEALIWASRERNRRRIKATAIAACIAAIAAAVTMIALRRYRQSSDRTDEQRRDENRSIEDAENRSVEAA